MDVYTFSKVEISICFGSFQCTDIVVVKSCFSELNNAASPVISPILKYIGSQLPKSNIPSIPNFGGMTGSDNGKNGDSESFDDAENEIEEKTKEQNKTQFDGDKDKDRKKRQIFGGVFLQNQNQENKDSGKFEAPNIMEMSSRELQKLNIRSTCRIIRDTGAIEQCIEQKSKACSEKAKSLLEEPLKMMKQIIDPYCVKGCESLLTDMRSLQSCTQNLNRITNVRPEHKSVPKRMKYACQKYDENIKCYDQTSNKCPTLLNYTSSNRDLFEHKLGVHCDALFSTTTVPSTAVLSSSEKNTASTNKSKVQDSTSTPMKTSTSVSAQKSTTARTIKLRHSSTDNQHSHVTSTTYLPTSTTVTTTTISTTEGITKQCRGPACDKHKMITQNSSSTDQSNKEISIAKHEDKNDKENESNNERYDDKSNKEKEPKNENYDDKYNEGDETNNEKHDDKYNEGDETNNEKHDDKYNEGDETNNEKRDDKYNEGDETNNEKSDDKYNEGDETNNEKRDDKYNEGDETNNEKSDDKYNEGDETNNEKRDDKYNEGDDTKNEKHDEMEEKHGEENKYVNNNKGGNKTARFNLFDLFKTMSTTPEPTVTTINMHFLTLPKGLLARLLSTTTQPLSTPASTTTLSTQKTTQSTTESTTLPTMKITSLTKPANQSVTTESTTHSKTPSSTQAGTTSKTNKHLSTQTLTPSTIQSTLTPSITQSTTILRTKAQSTFQSTTTSPTESTKLSRTQSTTILRTKSPLTTHPTSQSTIQSTKLSTTPSAKQFTSTTSAAFTTTQMTDTATATVSLSIQSSTSRSSSTSTESTQQNKLSLFIILPTTYNTSRTVAVGETLTLVCFDRSGSEVVWYKQGERIDPQYYSGFSIEKRNSRSYLTKKNVGEWDSGKYTCRSDFDRNVKADININISKVCDIQCNCISGCGYGKYVTENCTGSTCNQNCECDTVKGYKKTTNGMCRKRPSKQLCDRGITTTIIPTAEPEEFEATMSAEPEPEAETYTSETLCPEECYCSLGCYSEYQLQFPFHTCDSKKTTCNSNPCKCKRKTTKLEDGRCAEYLPQYICQAWNPKVSDKTSTKRGLQTTTQPSKWSNEHGQWWKPTAVVGEAVTTKAHASGVSDQTNKIAGGIGGTILGVTVLLSAVAILARKYRS